MRTRTFLLLSVFVACAAGQNSTGSSDSSGQPGKAKATHGKKKRARRNASGEESGSAATNSKNPDALTQENPMDPKGPTNPKNPVAPRTPINPDTPAGPKAAPRPPSASPPQ